MALQHNDCHNSVCYLVKLEQHLPSSYVIHSFSLEQRKAWIIIGYFTYYNSSFAIHACILNIFLLIGCSVCDHVTEFVCLRVCMFVILVPNPSYMFLQKQTKNTHVDYCYVESKAPGFTVYTCLPTRGFSPMHEWIENVSHCIYLLLLPEHLQSGFFKYPLTLSACVEVCYWSVWSNTEWCRHMIWPFKDSNQ